MPDKSESGIGISFGNQLPQSGIGIPASGSVRYRWSCIIPALPSYDFYPSNMYGTYFFKVDYRYETSEKEK
jgi:hypothetical protein